MTEPDLFSAAYPETPGAARHSRTSRDAAAAIMPRARTLREQVLELLRSAPLTADEAAAKLGKSVLSIRPRVTELLRFGDIADTGRTRRNASGVMATVWKAVEKGVAHG